MLTVVRHPLHRLVSAYRDKVERSSSWARRRLCAQLGRREERCEVSWREFVHHLTSSPTHLYDSHWAPVSSHCQVCHLNYRRILKVETLEEDGGEGRDEVGLELADLPHLNNNHNQRGEILR